MNLWTAFGNTRVEMPQSKGTLTKDALQDVFNHATQLKSAIALWRQSGLSRHYSSVCEPLEPLEQRLQALTDQCAIPRGATFPEIDARPKLPDAEWVVRLRTVAEGASNGAVSQTDMTECLRFLIRLTNETGDFLLETYQVGNSGRWPLPILTAMKGVISSVDEFTEFQTVKQRIEALRTETAMLAHLADVLELPEAGRLQAAATALKRVPGKSEG